MMKQRNLWLLVSSLLALSACNTDPKVQAQRYLENGNKFFAREKYKEASIMYRRALQKDGRFGEAFYRLGLTDLKLQAYTDAIRMLLRAVELQPNNSDAATKLADLYMVAALQNGPQTEQFLKEIKELADKLVTQNPKSFDGHRILGQLALVRRNPKDAIAEFEIANTIQPNQSDVVLVYFQALNAADRFPEAETLALNFLKKEKSYAPMYDGLYVEYVRRKRFQDAEELYKQKSANNPKNAGYVIQLASHYFYTKQRPEMVATLQRLDDEKTFTEGHILAGDFYMRIREFDTAQKEFEAGEKASSKEKSSYQKKLVELFYASNRPKEANDLLAEIIKNDPKDSQAVEMRAAMLLQTGNRDQINLAVNDLQSLVTKTPDNHVLRLELARALVARGDLEPAQLQLEEAIKIRPDYVMARELLSKIYLVRGDSKALKSAEDLIKIDPRNLAGHLVRATALLNIGDKDKAQDELNLITRNYPTNADARYLMGSLAFQEKDFKKAQETFAALYKEYPKDLRGLGGLVQTLTAQKQFPEAAKEVDKALASDPDRVDLKIMRGNLLITNEHFDDAIKQFQELVDKDPKNANLLYRLGESYRLKGDINTAIDVIRKATVAAPNDPGPLMQLGLLMEGTGKRDQAKPIYEQILKIMPDHFVALNNLAYIKAEEGTDLDQALTMAQKALQKQPTSTDVADTLGWIYIKKNLSDDAVRVYKDLVAKQPANPVFHYHFGMALMQKGDRPSARRELEEALKNKPSKDDGQKIRETLSQIGG
jgi:tetratricopeptide (TPR) repeat protein